MKMSIKIFGLSLLVLVLYSSGSLGQSPWLPGKNSYFIQFSYNTIPEYSTLYNLNSEDLQTPRKVVDNTLQLYGEYGLSDKFALVASIPYKLLKSGDINPSYSQDAAGIPEAATVNALGNVQLSLKYSLLQSDWVSALQMKVELPANVEKGDSTGLYPGYDAYAFAPYASIGRGWNRFYFYYYLSIISRTNGFDSKLDTGIEGGWKASKNFWLISYFNLLKSFNNGSKQPWPPERQFGLYSPDQEFNAFGIKVIYEVLLKNDQKIGFVAHGAGGTLFGFKVAKSPLLSLGIYLKK